MAEQTEPVEFTGSAGVALSGVLHDREHARGTLLLAHCFTCSKDLPTTARLARGLAAAGYRVLRFDFTGLGDSDGEFVDTTVATTVEDLIAAADALAERGTPPDGMVGHSLGGTAVVLAAGRIPSVRSLAVLNAPSSPTHLERLFSAAEDEIRREGEAVVQLAGRPFRISEAFLDDLRAHEVQRRLAELDRPLLVLHGLDDDEVPVAHGEQLFAHANQPKAFVPLLGAGHLLAGRRTAQEAASYLAGWFDRTT